MNGARQQQSAAYGNGVRAAGAGSGNGVYAYGQGNGSLSNGTHGMGVGVEGTSSSSMSSGTVPHRKTPSSSSNPAVTGSGPGLGAATGGKVRRPRPDTEEIKRVGRIHYQELLGFLRSHLARGQMGPRSNAREKLTRLSKQQFTELSTDVYDELMRRVDNARKGDEMPHLAVREEFHPKRNQARQKLATLPKTRFKDLASDVFFELERRFPELREEFRPEAVEQGAASREKPREVIAAQPSTADVVVPNKSKLVEEDVTVPYAKTLNRTKDGDNEEPPPGYDRDKGEGDRVSIRDSIVTADNDTDAFNRNTVYSQASSVGTGFFNGYAGSKATESIVASPHLGRSSENEGLSTAFGIEKMRSDYEFRIATLQQRVTALEAEAKQGGSSKEANILRGELDGAKELHNEQLKSLQKEIIEHRNRHDAKHSELQETLRKLDDLHDEHAALQKEREERGSVKGGEDGEAVRQELDSLQKEHSRQEELVTELRGEVSSLLEELRQLSSRNDEMLADKDSDQAVIRDLENQVSSYKRKYETAKTELRNMKATSQLYVQPPKADDFMPASDSGAIVDVNLTAFQSSIDELLAAARSKTPSNVLLAMKTVVLATTLVTDDVAKYESRSSTDSGPSEEKEQLTALRVRASNTLNNLMTACRNHASSHGLSPVSLLDAAASHVATTIVDIVKLLKVRKATKAEAEEFEATFTQNGTLPNGLKPLHTNALASSSAAKDPPFSPGYDRNKAPSENRLNPSSSTKGEGRFSPRSRHGPSMGRYSPVSYRPDLSRNNSQGEGSWKDSRTRTLSTSSASSAAAANAAGSSVPATPAMPMPLNASVLRSKSASSSRQQSEMGDEQQPPSQAQQERRDDAKGGQAQTNGFTISESPSWGSNLSEQQAKGSIGTSSPDMQPPLPAALQTSGDSSVEENWAELRNYIKVQTEAIVHSIQALLSSIREGAQSHQLTENLTQITTIVSSIVAISGDNLPNDEQSRLEGPKILKDLADNCERLSEMQTKQEFDKATKSAMAAASFGVAKGLKALTVLFEAADDADDLT